MDMYFRGLILLEYLATFLVYDILWKTHNNTFVNHVNWSKMTLKSHL